MNDKKSSGSSQVWDSVPSTRYSLATEKRLRGDSTPNEIMDSLRKRFGNPQGESENRRGSERKAWVTHLEIHLQEVTPMGIVETCQQVMTHDISTGGLSFIAKRFVHPGSQIETCFQALPNQPRIRGIVRNCVHVGGPFHRVGVQFVASLGEE